MRTGTLPLIPALLVTVLIYFIDMGWAIYGPSDCGNGRCQAGNVLLSMTVKVLHSETNKGQMAWRIPGSAVVTCINDSETDHYQVQITWTSWELDGDHHSTTVVSTAATITETTNTPGQKPTTVPDKDENSQSTTLASTASTSTEVVSTTKTTAPSIPDANRVVPNFFGELVQTDISDVYRTRISKEKSNLASLPVDWNTGTATDQSTGIFPSSTTTESFTEDEARSTVASSTSADVSSAVDSSTIKFFMSTDSTTLSTNKALLTRITETSTIVSSTIDTSTNIQRNEEASSAAPFKYEVSTESNPRTEFSSLTGHKKRGKFSSIDAELLCSDAFSKNSAPSSPLPDDTILTTTSDGRTDATFIHNPESSTTYHTTTLGTVLTDAPTESTSTEMPWEFQSTVIDTVDRYSSITDNIENNIEDSRTTTESSGTPTSNIRTTTENSWTRETSTMNNDYDFEEITQVNYRNHLSEGHAMENLQNDVEINKDSCHPFCNHDNIASDNFRSQKDEENVLVLNLTRSNSFYHVSDVNLRFQLPPTHEKGTHYRVFWKGVNLFPGPVDTTHGCEDEVLPLNTYFKLVMENVKLAAFMPHDKKCGFPDSKADCREKYDKEEQVNQFCQHAEIIMITIGAVFGTLLLGGIAFYIGRLYCKSRQEIEERDALP